MNIETCDRILMKNMIFHSHVGVLEKEKEDGQDFEIDVTFFCRRLSACQTDLLAQTIDYGMAFNLIRQITEPAQYDLIERLAGAIADQLLHAFRLANAVEVVVRKPKAPIDGRFLFMGVQIYRERS